MDVFARLRACSASEHLLSPAAPCLSVSFASALVSVWKWSHEVTHVVVFSSTSCFVDLFYSTSELHATFLLYSSLDVSSLIYLTYLTYSNYLIYSKLDLDLIYSLLSYCLGVGLSAANYRVNYGDGLLSGVFGGRSHQSCLLQNVSCRALHILSFTWYYRELYGTIVVDMVVSWLIW